MDLDKTLQELRAAIRQYRTAADGPSGDALHDAANEVADRAEALADQISDGTVLTELRHIQRSEGRRVEFGAGGPGPGPGIDVRANKVDVDDYRNDVLDAVLHKRTR